MVLSRSLSMQEVHVLLETANSQCQAIHTVLELPELAVVLFELFNEQLVWKWVLELL